jgi:hypothetical protein
MEQGGESFAPHPALSSIQASTSREVGVMLNGKRAKLATALLTVLLVSGFAIPIDKACANDCASQCYAAENACRRATQGSSSCDAQLTRCLQACRKK